MVLASRGWPFNGLAARNARGAYARLLLLSGIVAVAWLAGGMGVAHSETTADSGGLVDSVLGVGEVAERTGQTAADEVRQGRLAETTARVTDSTEALADGVSPHTSGLPVGELRNGGVSSAIEGSAIGSVADDVVTDTAKVVDGTARGASGLVGGVARTGQGVVEATDESLREAALVDSVTEGLSESVGHGLSDSVAEAGAPLGLPILGASDETEPSSVPEERPGAQREDEEGEQRRSPIEAGVPAHVVEAGWRVAAEAAQSVARQTAEEDASAERVRLIGGGSQHQAGPDATGASAPSFPAPGAAGFLMNRSGHLVFRIQRVALPGDPTLVVRDAADDPSYSPD